MRVRKRRRRRRNKKWFSKKEHFFFKLARETQRGLKHSIRTRPRGLGKRVECGRKGGLPVALSPHPLLSSLCVCVSLRLCFFYERENLVSVSRQPPLERRGSVFQCVFSLFYTFFHFTCCVCVCCLCVFFLCVNVIFSTFLHHTHRASFVVSSVD